MSREVCISHDIGVIAGTVLLGMGRFVTLFDEGNDGIITVSETRLPRVKNYLCLPVNYEGLIISHNVIDQVAVFLKRG
jgi:hypothetical protein